MRWLTQNAIAGGLGALPDVVKPHQDAMWCQWRGGVKPVKFAPASVSGRVCARSTLQRHDLCTRTLHVLQFQHSPASRDFFCRLPFEPSTFLFWQCLPRTTSCWKVSFCLDRRITQHYGLFHSNWHPMNLRVLGQDWHQEGLTWLCEGMWEVPPV